MFINIPNLSNSRGFHAGNPDRSNNNCLEFEAIDNKETSIRSDFNCGEFATIKIVERQTGRLKHLKRSSSHRLKIKLAGKDRD